MVGESARGLGPEAHLPVNAEWMSVKGSGGGEETRKKRRGRVLRNQKEEMEKQIAFWYKQAKWLSKRECCVGPNNVWIKGV